MGRGKDDNESGNKQNCKSKHGIDKSIHPPIPLQGWLCVILVHIMMILLIMKRDESFLVKKKVVWNQCIVV